MERNILGGKMKKISLDYSKISKFVNENELNELKNKVELVSEKLYNKTGAGNDFLGWLDLPVNYDKEEFARIKKASEKIKSDSEVLVVIGIGGSYLGARAVIECLSHSFFNSLSKEKRNAPEIYFAGQNISGTYLKDLIEIIGDRDFSVNVISKSGTTTEPAIKIVSPFLTLTLVVKALPTLEPPSELYVPEFISFIFKTFLLNLKSLNSKLISKTI